MSELTKGITLGVLIKGITLEQFYRDLNNVRDMDVGWDVVQLSAVVAEPKRGEWFDVGSMSCRCSNCGCKSTKEYSFCPNCGADMRGRKDG